MLRLEWPDADHQDLHHRNMMPILPPGIPYTINEATKRFFSFLKRDDWHSAARMVSQKVISIEETDSHRNNIFDYAAGYIASTKRNSLQLQPLFFLVDEAIKVKLKIRMNYAFFMNPLHDLAMGIEDDVTLKFLNHLLEYIDPIYLNAYNKFGKTPLLEAISRKNEKTALKLLEHPEIDVNLFKIHNISTRADANKAKIFQNYALKHGCSAFDAATSLGLTEVAQRIRQHSRYDSSLRYVYPDSGDVIRVEHFLFAEQGNGDTFMVLFKNFDAETLMCVDDLYWTMLNVACFAANLPIVEFLLDKDKLDRVAGFTIPEGVYVEFVNRRDDLFSTALGRVLVAAGQDYDIKKEEQISLFIKCRHFRVNDAIQCAGDALIHYIAKNNLVRQMADLSERGDVDYDRENLLGQTALEVAAIAGHFEIVDLLSKMVKGKKIVINPNRYSRKCSLVERLRFFMEEGWFGPVSIEGLTVDDLIEVYRTKESHKIQVTYREFVIKFEVIYESGPIVEDIESLKKHLSYFFNRANNKIEMILVDWPSWIDKNLYQMVEDCLKRLYGEHFPLESNFSLNVNGTKLKIIGKPHRLQQVTRVGAIDYKRLCGFLQSEDSREEREKMLSADYLSLLATVIDQAQQEQGDHKRNNLLKVVQVLVRFPGIKLNILVKKADQVCYIDEFIELPEITRVFVDARLSNQSLISAAKKTNALSEKLAKAKQMDSSLYRFAKSFVYNIERKSIERQFHHFYKEDEFRRLDALARLFEADGDCAAVYFDGNRIFYATNTAKDAPLKQLGIIKDILKYFSEIITPTALNEDSNKKKINLIGRIVEAKALNGFKKQKRDLFKRKVFDPLLSKIIGKFDLLEKMIFEEGISLDKENVLTEQSFQKVLSLCGMEQFTELNKADTEEKIIGEESFCKRINAILKFFIRAFLILRKLKTT